MPDRYRKSADYQSVTSVTLPDSAPEISETAFSGCPRLTFICREHSLAQRYCEENHLNYIFDYQFEAYHGVIPEGVKRLSSPFLADLDWDAAAVNSGMEVYCVVGRDPDCRITVTEWSIDENGQGTAGETLYDSDSGAPVLLMGNISDIMPNLMVTVTAADGESLSYAPCLSLKDGLLDRGGTEGVYDFTVYFDLPPEGIPDYSGDWAAFDVSDHDGREYTCCLTIAPDGTVDYFYYDEPGVILERFTGTAVNNEDEGTVSLDLTLTGGRYMEEGAPEYSSWGTYRVEKPDNDTLILTLLDGDRLPYGLDIETIRFGRTVG